MSTTGSDRMLKQNPDIVLQSLEDELVLYDPVNDRVHVLNHTANKVWQLCDGEHSINSIVKHLCCVYPGMAAQSLFEDVTMIVEEFSLQDLIIIC